MAPLYRHPYYRIRRCRRRSCSCGGGLPLHEQAARAKVARSSAQPEGLRSASRRQSRRSCSASQRTPPRTGATHRQFHGAAPCAVLLHAPAARKRSASAATGACCAVTLRTAPCPLRGHSAGSASPVPGLAPQREEKNEKNIHPCTSTSAFAHLSEKMLITSQRFARSVAPCSKAFHAEKNARKPRCGKLPHARPV